MDNKEFSKKGTKATKAAVYSGGLFGVVNRMRNLMGAVALLLVMSLTLGACGSNSSDTNTGSDTNAGTSSMVASTGVGSGLVGSGNNTTSTSNNANLPISAQNTAATTNQTSSGGLVNPSGNLENDIQTVVEKVRPAVVLIVARGSQQEGAGTGSIITPDGFIVTNHHVIEPAAGGGSITVVLDNGQKLTAQVAGDVPGNDLAILKIGGSNLPTIPLGSSSSAKVGQWTVAIGNALALPGGPTVTAGIVSAIGRSIDEPNGATLNDLVQTSAAINPGNSGGPLLNLNGEMIGINTAAPVDPESQSAAQGIGFAIPVDQAKTISQQVISGGGTQSGGNPVAGRPYVGITSQDVTPTLAGRYNLPVNQGVYVLKVISGSPAAQAGLKAGQIIIGMDGQQVNNQNDVVAILNKHKPGDSVNITVVNSQGQQGQTSVKLGQQPQQ